MTFIEFVQSSPGMTGYAVEMYRVIDAQAERVGKMLTDHRVYSYEVNETMSPSLASSRIQLRDALERDPSGKLAAVPSLRAWAAGPDGIGQTWVNWFVMYYSAYLDAQKAPKLVPMMAE